MLGLACRAATVRIMDVRARVCVCESAILYNSNRTGIHAARGNALFFQQRIAPKPAPLSTTSVIGRRAVRDALR